MKEYINHCVRMLPEAGFIHEIMIQIIHIVVNVARGRIHNHEISPGSGQIICPLTSISKIIRSGIVDGELG